VSSAAKGNRRERGEFTTTRIYFKSANRLVAVHFLYCRSGFFRNGPRRGHYERLQEVTVYVRRNESSRRKILDGGRCASHARGMVVPIIKSMGIWQLGKKDVVIGRGSCARHGLGEFFLFFFVMTDSLCLHSSIVSFTLILLFVPAISLFFRSYISPV